MTTTACTVGTHAKRVVFDARPAETCVTGIGRYARTLKSLMKGVQGHFCWSLGEDLKWTPRSPLDEELELPSLLERESVDIFHSPLFHLPAILPCRSIITLHDAIPLVRPDLSNEAFTKLFHERALDAAERADAVVCPSEHAKKDLVRTLGLPPEKVHVIVEMPAPHFRVLENRSTTRDFCLVVGSLEKRKNPGVVLEALAKFSESERPRVVFVGPDGGIDLLEEAGKHGVLGSVERRGIVSDEELVRLYNDAIALICPSLYEGFGLPIVEAFACGTPVISSDAASLPEVAGDAAILCDPNDAQALAEAMRSLDDMHRNELRALGFRRLESFGARGVSERLARLYSELNK